MYASVFINGVVARVNVCKNREGQEGFRKGRGYVNQTTTEKILIEKYMTENTK